MNRLKRWLEGVVERFCDWMNDALPGRHRLALLGNGLAGLPGLPPLPVDRRVDPAILQNHWNGGENSNAAHAKAGTASVDTSCGFWAYCHMKGQACVWCGGKNALLPGNPYNDLTLAGTDLCPSFSVTGKAHGGTAWYGCCKDPSGTGKLIAFLDCCGSHTVPCKFTRVCRNWPEAKNWCVSGVNGWIMRDGAQMPVYYTEEYYCTVVINMNADKQCN